MRGTWLGGGEEGNQKKKKKTHLVPFSVYIPIWPTTASCENVTLRFFLYVEILPPIHHSLFLQILTSFSLFLLGFGGLFACGFF